MSAVHELLKARFAYVRQDLEEVLAKLRDEDLTWRPADGMPTISDLLLEIANKEMETVEWIRRGAWPDGEPDAFEASATRAAINDRLASLRVETFAFIDSLTDAQLDEPVFSPERWWEALRLTQCPVAEVLRNIAAHEWYHTGQLVTYLWLRGENPND